MPVAPLYPSGSIDRDHFVLDRRAARPAHDPWRHQGVLVEEERAADGTIVDVATIFLTGRECPWRCVMCDLWQHTIAEDTPPGALVTQIDDALVELRHRGQAPSHVKLYNAGSFFDPRAVPEADYESIAVQLTSFRHVIVESHPALLGRRVTSFLEALARAAHGGSTPDLEVAMGLETAHPDALERLHKRFTPVQFAEAADSLRSAGVSLRVFLLVGVPFIPRQQQQEWIARSIAFAFGCGASVVTLIPTRPGNGALEALAAAHVFEPPTLEDLENAFDNALPGAGGRVFADLWDLERFSSCASCLASRRERLCIMNLEQRVLPRVPCERCARTVHTA